MSSESEEQQPGPGGNRESTQADLFLGQPLHNSLPSQPTPPQQFLDADSLNIVSADNIRRTKEWQTSLRHDGRSYMVYRLIHAIFPRPSPRDYLDTRYHTLVSYARKVEGDKYRAANSRSEYYHLVAEKIYKIQKELEEKRAKRKLTHDGQQPRSY